MRAGDPNGLLSYGRHGSDLRRRKEPGRCVPLEPGYGRAPPKAIVTNEGLAHSYPGSPQARLEGNPRNPVLRLVQPWMKERRTFRSGLSLFVSTKTMLCQVPSCSS